VKLEVAAEVFREDFHIVAYAKALDLSSSGKTETEAIQALIEAVRLFVLTSLEMGTLDQILTEGGYVRRGDEWIRPQETPRWSTDNIMPLSESTQRLACVEI
jgi:hypothetical protein